MKRAKTDNGLPRFLSLFLLIAIFPLFVVKEYRILKIKKGVRISHAFHSANDARGGIREKRERPFTIIVMAKDNGENIERNFCSVIAQRYSDYKVVYIDQSADDRTRSLLRCLVRKQRASEKVTIVRARDLADTHRLYADVIRSLGGEEIVVRLSGDDCLADDRVLRMINRAYVNPNVWMTYGRYRSEGKAFVGDVGRAVTTRVSCKSFYAKYFKAIDPDSKKGRLSHTFENDENFKGHIRRIPHVLHIRSMPSDGVSN
ncbi:MAG: glycosyltransferase family A protein [Simkaniaceae bacterium]|nr:glycosyltransferase family A protein [Simkaniaceae bacterium]